MTSDKKEFLQKYMLDSYSRAIPTNALPGKKASLGEYCDPVDSRKGQGRRRAEDSEDSDPGYALPQDAIDSRMSHHSRDPQAKVEPSMGEANDADVYELAQNPVKSYDTPPPTRQISPKPAPKPRTSTHRKSHHPPEATTSDKDLHLTKTPSRDDNAFETRVDPVVPGDEVPRGRRPSKKVVEIEYEVASEIRYSKHQSPGVTSVSPPPPPSIAATASAFSPVPQSYNECERRISNNILPVSTGSPAGLRKSSSTQRPVITLVNPPAAPSKVPTPQHSTRQDSVYSMGKPETPSAPAESMYEEPWDLKVRRLKQKEEQRASKAAGAAINKTELSDAPAIGAPVNVFHGAPAIGAPDSVFQANSESVYEDAWDTAAQQRKLEARLNYARSLSTTSETTEIFHDALDSLPNPKTDTQTEKPTETKLKPLPSDTYEDAWDLKNNILEQKIRAMQVQASATYEEPWDLKKKHQQQQLQARMSANPAQSSGSSEATASAPGAGRGGGNGNGGGARLVRQKSSQDAYDQSWPGSDSHSHSHSASTSRGKQLSMDDPSRTKAKLRGSNIGRRINPMIPLANQNWYHGNITRDDAEKMLRVCKEGSYIVRISSDRKSYSLSIKSSKQNIHVQIEQVGLLDGSVRYILGKNSKEFCSIPEMIDYYTHHRVPLKGAEHITLLHPVECKWSSNNPP